MHTEICAAIQLARQRTSVKILDDPERRAPRKGQIEIEARNQPWRDVIDLVVFQPGQRDRRIYVVKSSDADGAPREPFSDRDTIGNIGAENDEVGIPDQFRIMARKFG